MAHGGNFDTLGSKKMRWAPILMRVAQVWYMGSMRNCLEYHVSKIEPDVLNLMTLRYFFWITNCTFRSVVEILFGFFSGVCFLRCPVRCSVNYTKKKNKAKGTYRPAGGEEAD